MMFREDTDNREYVIEEEEKKIVNEEENEYEVETVEEELSPSTDGSSIIPRREKRGRPGIEYF